MSATWLLFSFRGRIGRLAYWMGSLIQLFGLFLVVRGITAFVEAADARTSARWLGPVMVVGLLCGLALVAVNLAVCAKRFHDRDRSLWRFLIILVPIIGPTWLLIELGCLPGTPGTNRYGPVPEPLARDGSQADAEHGQWTNASPDLYGTPSPVVERLTGPQRTPPPRRQFGRRGLD